MAERLGAPVMGEAFTTHGRCSFPCDHPLAAAALLAVGLWDDVRGLRPRTKLVLQIAAALFLRFCEKNRLIYDKEGHKRIADNALVAMALMIAESRPKEKDVITAMLTNLIAGK